VYEHKDHLLLPWRRFLNRALLHFLVGLAVVSVAVGIGTVGYHLSEGLGWLDSFLNASMILSGMGPVNRMETTAAKWFASLYALFSGVIFIVIMGVILAPWAHRLLHVHLQTRSK
jgi:hypothetical protein